MLSIRKSTRFGVIKKKLAYFHYHLKCQNITDTEGDIEIDLMKLNNLKMVSFDDNDEI